MRFVTPMTLALLTLVGASAHAQEVSYDYDRNVDFTRFRSYSWTGEAGVPDQFLHRRIVAAIDSQLVRHQVLPADSGAAPDLRVAYLAAAGRTTTIRGSGAGFGWGRSGSARVEHTVIGVLEIQLFDARTGTLVWRGDAAVEIDPNASPEKRDREANKAAEKLFTHYPAGH